jgi:hypothetical protein
MDNKLYDDYHLFKEESIKHRRFKHNDITSIIDKLKSNEKFKIRNLGQSIEGRSIRLVSIGKGETSVLLWSQMHGDEPTATMAIMDLFNFFGHTNDYEQYKADILDRVTIHFIPMLNPDGAEKYQRRNAAGIDLNRDALRLQFPESQILKKVRDSLNADWGFNLHDQSRYYGAGKDPKTASISFLAPAYNFEKDTNQKRGDAMKLISVMNGTLQKFIPGKVAKYSDEFEPRAFGDNIQKWGTSTILIESGGLVNDREKQELRRINFIALLKAFESIANKTYKNQTSKPYKDLPFNKTRFHDVLIRNVTITKDGKEYKMDIALRQDEIDNADHSAFYLKGYISDLGDLHTYFGYTEIDASGYKYIPGMKYPSAVSSMKELNSIGIIKLINEGYTDFEMEALLDIFLTSNFPVYMKNNLVLRSNEAVLSTNPSFYLEKDGIKKYLIVNGHTYNLEQDEQKIKNLLRTDE